MSKQRLFLVLLTFLPLTLLVAQPVPRQLLTVVPPSPTVASLGKYGDVPVSLYTGVPEISIPLYEIKSGSLDLPITLSYHAGGVKVEEIASSAGLGWTLNAGGVIGRNVRGLADEISPWYPQSSANSIGNIMSSNNSDKIQQLVKDVDRGERDGEADLYYYNFNQFSGKFFYDQQGGVHTVPAKNMLIHPIVGGWQVTTEDGTVYLFTKVEEVSSATCSGDGSVDAAWFLTSIKSVDGKRAITFTYEPINYTYETLIGQTKYFSINSTGSTCMKNPSPCLGTQNYNTHRLVRIDFEGGYIKFNFNTARCDLMGDKSLDEMKVYNTSNQLIKGFTFGHAYFGDNGACNFLTKNSKRLKLISVREETDSQQKPPYRFEYYETVELPDRLSYAQDHWGYYNGKLSNSGLIATFTTTVNTGAQITFPGADRKANPATAQAGVLNKINYPTGGQTIFTYESNTVSDNQVEPQEETTKNEGLFLSASNESLYLKPSPYESNSLTIPAQGAEMEFHISGLPIKLWEGCDYVQCLVIKDNNPVPFLTIGNSWDGTTANWPAGTYKIRLMTDCNMDARASFSVSIIAKIPITKQPDKIRPVGGLRIQQIEDNPGNGGQSIVKRYRYHSENDPTHSSGVLVNFPDYGYDLGVESIENNGSGEPLGPSTHCSYRVRQSFSNYPLATTQGSYVGYSQVMVDFGENGESWYTFDAHPDSKTPFPFAPEDNGDLSRGFLLYTKDFTRKNGALILARETIHTPYNFNRFSVSGVKTGRDYYTMVDGEMPPRLQALPKYSFYSTITEAYTLGQTKERLYDQDDPAKFIETVTDFTYSLQHLQLVQSRSVTGNLNETTIEETVSNKKYPFDYTFNGSPSGSEATAIKNLQDLHVVNAVMEEYVFKQNRNTVTNQLSDQRVIDGSIAIYKKDKPYPDQLLKLEIGAPVSLTNFGSGSSITNYAFIKNANPFVNDSYKPAILFNSYDDKGNITTQQKVNDVKKSYVWGYDYKYPVAEVVGVDYATIMANANLDQAILQAASSSEGAIRAELNKLRTAFPAAQVTTYTYKPLVGISSQTDINNRSMYYDYDSFGRVTLIRDHDKNILKKFCYNYQGQTQSCIINVEDH